MTKSAKVLVLSTLALVCAGIAQAQAGPPVARVAVLRVQNPAIPNPDPSKPADWLYKVRPATVLADRDLKMMYVTNFTDLEMTVTLASDFPADGKPSAPADLPDSKRKRSIVKFKDLKGEKVDGVFSYEVTLKDAAGNSYAADGESAPRVIIDP